MNAAARLCALAAILVMAVAVPAQATVWGHTTVWDDATTLDDPSDGATPVFDTGDPETESWGPTESLTSSLAMPNGATAAADFLYLGQNAAASTWTATAGPNLTETGSSSTPTFEVQAPFADATETVTFDGTLNSYEASGSYGAASGEDWVFVIVGKTARNAAANRRLFDIENGSGTLRLTANTSGTCSLNLDRDGGSTRFQVLDSCNNGPYFVLVQTADSSADTFRLYGQGVFDEEDSVGSTGALTGDLSIWDANVVGEGHGVVAVGMWTGTDLFDSSAEQDTFAAELSAKIMGSYLPTGGTPSTATRASTAYLRKCDETANTVTYHEVTDNWPRREVSCGYTWDDPTSSETTVANFLQEDAATSRVDYSYTFTDAAWTKLRSTVSDDVESGPFGLGCDGIVGNTDNNTHAIVDSIDFGSAGTSLNFVAKAGDQDWFAIRRSGSYYALYDLSTCAAGSFHEDVTSSDCRDLGNGFCHCMFTDDTTTAGGSAGFYPATADDADADLAELEFVGDGATVNATLCAVWVDDATEIGFTSPILTVDATDVTRSADSGITYAATGPTSGTIVVDLLATGPSNRIFDVSDGTTSERAHLVAQASGDRLNGIVRGTGGSAANGDLSSAGGDFVAGDHHIIRMTYAPDDLESFIDGTSVATDSTSGDPTGMDEVTVGSATWNNNPADSSIYRARLFSGVIAPGEQGTGDDTP